MNLSQLSEDGELFDVDSLPPGYRFDPTDAEIIVYYLRKKVDHQPLPPNKIIEVNLYAYDPHELAARYDPPSGNDEWFYFTPRDRKYPKGQRPNRSVGDGYWKATGADKEIKFEGRKVGYRKALVFYRGGSCPHGVKTNWIMHEFRVAEPPEPPRRSGVDDMRLDDCVLCRVYRKNDSKDRDCKRPRDEYGNDDLSSSSKIPRLELNPNKADNQLTVGGGMESVQERINSHEALQNQQPIIQIPESANAVFPQDSLQVLPPAGTDVSFHGQNNLQVLPLAGSDVSFHGQTNLQVLPLAGTDVSFHGQNNLQVLPPAGTDDLQVLPLPGTDVSFHGQNNLQVLPPAGPDDLQVLPFAGTDVSLHGQNNLQLLPPAGTDVSLYGQNNLQLLPSAGTDVSFQGQNNNLMQSSMEFPFPYLDYSWDSEFHSSIIDNAALVSSMDLNPGYYQTANTDNTGLASTTDFDTYYMMGVDIGNANLDSTADLNSILDRGFFPPPADAKR